MVENHFPARYPVAAGRAALGHEERFPLTRLTAGYGFRKETIARMRRNGRDAPLAAILLGWIKPPRSIPLVAF